MYFSCHDINIYSLSCKREKINFQKPLPLTGLPKSISIKTKEWSIYPGLYFWFKILAYTSTETIKNLILTTEMVFGTFPRVFSSSSISTPPWIN